MSSKICRMDLGFCSWALNTSGFRKMQAFLNRNSQTLAWPIFRVECCTCFWAICTGNWAGITTRVFSYFSSTPCAKWNSFGTLSPRNSAISTNLKPHQNRHVFDAQFVPSIFTRSSRWNSKKNIIISGRCVMPQSPSSSKQEMNHFPTSLHYYYTFCSISIEFWLWSFGTGWRPEWPKEILRWCSYYSNSLLYILKMPCPRKILNLTTTFHIDSCYYQKVLFSHNPNPFSAGQR